MKYVLLLTIVIQFLATVTLLARDLNGTNSDTNSKKRAQNIGSVTSAFPIKWPNFYGVQQTGEIQAVFDCFGNFGNNFGQGPINSSLFNFSFATPIDPPVEYLYGGSIWIGGIVGQDTLVSTGLDGWYSVAEMFPPGFPDNGTVMPVDYIADFSLRAEFTDAVNLLGNSTDPFDGNHRPLNLKIANRSHAWHSSPENGTIIYDIVVTNIGSEIIHKGVVGLYFDADVGNGNDTYTDDLAGSLKEQGIGYIIDNDGDFNGTTHRSPKIFATKFLANSFQAADTSFAWWISGVFGPRIRGTLEDPFRDFGTGELGTPIGDKNKYYIMSHKEWDYDQAFTASIKEDDSTWLLPNHELAQAIAKGGDARILISLGPFELEPDSSIRVLCATFTGDSVHFNNQAFGYLPDSPQVYLSLLNFEDVFANSNISDSLAQVLLDPSLPPLGLGVVRNIKNDLELQWDPWVYEDVRGYKVFIEEADLSTLPHPGAIPPWWTPSPHRHPINVGRTHRLNINWADPDTHYLAQIRHRVKSNKSELSMPINFKLNPQAPRPVVPLPYAMALPGQPVKLVWNNSGNIPADHFNIYKFPDVKAARQAYHPFYDDGYQSHFIQPKDSFNIDGNNYYYYAMEPYAKVNGDDSVYFDGQFSEGDAYVIASSDEYGFESGFSQTVTAFIGVEKNRDILVITNGPASRSRDYTIIDSVISFYESVLQGLDYDIYSFRDTLAKPECVSPQRCDFWRDFLRYKLVILDDQLESDLGFYFVGGGKLTDAFSKVLANGGQLCAFGLVQSQGAVPFLDGSPVYAPIGLGVSDLFGVQSFFASGLGYYYNSPVPIYIDSIFGFIKAQQTDGSLPTLNLDVSRDPFSARLRQYWPMVTPPGVATFLPDEYGEVTHQFQSLYETASVQQGHAVGIRKNWPLLNTTSNLFGFHLWYMDTADARDLIETMLYDSTFALGGEAVVVPNHFDLQTTDSTLDSVVSIYVGDLESNIEVSEIDIATVKVNYSISPAVIQVLDTFPGFESPVLKIEVIRHDFLNSIHAISGDSAFTALTVTGKFQDSADFRVKFYFTISGYSVGDFDNNNFVTILDLTFLINFLFRNGPPPGPIWLGDTNRDQIVDIQDLVKIVDHMFRGFSI